MFVSCDTQAEIDELWNALSAGGREERCGWLTDKFGLCWQLIPPVLARLLGHSDTEIAQKAHEAMMQMIKIDIAVFEAIENCL